MMTVSATRESGAPASASARGGTYPTASASAPSRGDRVGGVAYGPGGDGKEVQGGRRGAARCRLDRYSSAWQVPCACSAARFHAEGLPPNVGDACCLVGGCGGSGS